MNSCSPENFICHPVADSGKATLHEYYRFDWRFAVPIQKSVDKLLVKFRGNDFGRVAFPPIGFCLRVLELDSAKLTRVREDEGALDLIEDEMVVSVGTKIRRLNPNVSGHAEMQAEPVVAGGLKQHSLPPPC